MEHDVIHVFNCDRTEKGLSRAKVLVPRTKLLTHTTGITSKAYQHVDKKEYATWRSMPHHNWKSSLRKFFHPRDLTATRVTSRVLLG